MSLNKEKKSKIIDDLREKVNKQKIIIFANFSGTKVGNFTDLRKRLRLIGCDLRVAKKTLAKIVFSEKGLEIDSKKLPGEVALVFGYEEEILPSKTVYEFSSINPSFKIIGGVLENNYTNGEDIITLAKLPSREELLAKLVGSIASPMAGLLNSLQGNIKGLVYILSSIKK